MRNQLEELTKHIPGTADFIKIDQSKCNGCGLCARICIVNLWGIKDSVAFIRDDYKEKCLECGSCGQVCEPNAIAFSYPAGGTGIVYEQG
jgi:ferredoxin